MSEITARNVPTALIWLSGIMFITTVAALTALTIVGAETEAIESIAKPLLAGLILSGIVGVGQASQSRRLDHQDEKLATIAHQTNGVLDKRIKDGAKAALLELAEDERQGRVSGSASDG